MDGKGKTWCEELFDKMKLNEKNPFAKLEIPIKNTMELVYGIIGEMEYAPQIRSVFYDYLNKSVGSRLRSVKDYGAYHPEEEITEILSAIVDTTKKYKEKIRNNGSEDTSGIYRNMLLRIDTFYTPQGSDDPYSAVVPRHRKKRILKNHDFDIER